MVAATGIEPVLLFCSSIAKAIFLGQAGKTSTATAAVDACRSQVQSLKHNYHEKTQSQGLGYFVVAATGIEPVTSSL